MNFNGDSFDQFDDAVAQIFANLTSITRKNGRLPATLMKKSNGVCRVTLSSGVVLHFNFKDITEDANPISHVLHGSDLDVSQAAFTGQINWKSRTNSSSCVGNRLLCTFAFLQALATKSFMCYTMHGKMDKSICNRIARYCQRGFTFLQSVACDSLSYMDIMASTVTEDRTQQTRVIVNDDGDVQTVTMITYARRLPFPNVDTYRLQEDFIKRMKCT